MYSDEIVEKFGFVNQETGEVEVDRVALKRDYVNRGVAVMREIEMLKGDLKGIVEDAKELHNFNKAELNKLIKYVYANTIEDDIAELEEIQVSITNLFPEDSVDD